MLNFVSLVFNVESQFCSRCDMENQPEVHNDHLNGSQASGSIDRRTYSYDDDKRLHKVSFFFFRFLSARAFPLTGVLASVSLPRTIQWERHRDYLVCARFSRYKRKDLPAAEGSNYLSVHRWTTYNTTTRWIAGEHCTRTKEAKTIGHQFCIIDLIRKVDNNVLIITTNDSNNGAIPLGIMTLDEE